MELILSILVGLFALPALIGLFVIYHIFIRGKKNPADKSNRLNHLRLFWFALTREDKFVNVFPWLKNDEWDNFQD